MEEEKVITVKKDPFFHKFARVMLIGIFPLGLINYFLWGFITNYDNFIIHITITLLLILYLAVNIFISWKEFSFFEKVGGILFFSMFYFINVLWLCNIFGAIITIFKPAEIHQVYVDYVKKKRHSKSWTPTYYHYFIFDNGKNEMFSFKAEKYEEDSCLKVKYKQNLFVKYIYIQEKLSYKNKTDCLSKK